MKRSATRAVVLAALGAGVASACVSADEVYMPTGSGSGTGGGTTSASTGGVTTSSGTGGATSSSGTGATSSSSSGGGGSAPVGRNATETVNGGMVAKNAEYRMVFTLGQPALGQKKAAGSGLRLQGGLIGATETTP